MNPKEKNMLLGALATGFSDLANLLARRYYPDYPPELAQQFEKHLPAPGVLLSVGGVPLGAFATSKLAKSPATKEKVKDMAKGAAFYAIPRLLVETLYMTAQAEVQTPGQFNIDYGFPTTNIISGVGFSHRAPSPYVTKEQRLPFQTDLGY